MGICFAGVQKTIINHPSLTANLSESLRLQWMGKAEKIQQRNEVLNRQCVELQKSIKADGFRTFIMKGQGNAALYGSLSALRQSGDIDIYLEGGLYKVLSYARTFGDVTKVNELEMSAPVFRSTGNRQVTDTEVEFHYCPFTMRNPFGNARQQRFFKGLRFDYKE